MAAYHPGERVPWTTDYVVIGPHAGIMVGEVHCEAGEPFPPAPPNHHYVVKDINVQWEPPTA